MHKNTASMHLPEYQPSMVKFALPRRIRRRGGKRASRLYSKIRGDVELRDGTSADMRFSHAYNHCIGCQGSQESLRLGNEADVKVSQCSMVENELEAYLKTIRRLVMSATYALEMLTGRGAITTAQACRVSLGHPAFICSSIPADSCEWLPVMMSGKSQYRIPNPAHLVTRSEPP